MKLSDQDALHALIERNRATGSDLTYDSLAVAGQASDTLLETIVGALKSDEALRLLRMLWARFRDDAPAWLRWLVDRGIGSLRATPQPSDITPTGRARST